jgi:hypothetical protein
MPRTCTVCAHLKRAEIDRALVADSASLRDIARQYEVSKDALDRHKKGHLPTTLVQAKAAQETSDAVDVMAELQRCFERVNLLFDACDRWLRDADDPTRYDIGPRATELDVTYDEIVRDRNGTPRTVRRKRKLAELLETIESDSRSVVMVETKYADPRELVLKTATRLQGQIELLAKLLDLLNEGDTINIAISPQWVEARTVLFAALAEHPEARLAVAAALQAIEGGDGANAA